MDWQILLNTRLLLVISILGVLLGYKFLQNLLGKLTITPTQAWSMRRRLGKLEACLDQLSQQRGGTVNVCLILSLKSKTKLLKIYVREALLVLAKRQPLFRAVMTSIPSGSALTKDRHLKIIDGNKINDMINLQSVHVRAREWQLVWHEIATMQRGTGLLWQAVILQEEFLPETKNYINTIIFNMNRCCCDGVSSMELCKHFLRYLDDAAQGLRRSNEDIPSLRLWPSLCDLVERGRRRSPRGLASEWYGIHHIFNFITKIIIRYLLFRKQYNPFFVQFPPGMGPSASFTPRSRLMYKVFSESETLKIEEACISNASTVTGALMAATHMAFCKLIQEGSLRDQDCKLEHWFPINARRDCYLKPPEKYLGQFTLLHSLSLQYTEGADFWKLTREILRRIHSEIKEENHIKKSMATLHSFSAEELVDEMLGPSDRQTLTRLSSCNMVCSAASFEFRQEEKHYTYKLHECLYNSPIHGLATTFGHFIARVNGKMSWVILYDPSRVKQAEAKKFSSLCFKYFLEIDR